MTEALLVIDMQAGFYGHDDHWGGVRNNPGMEERGRAILKAARAHGALVHHAVHDSLEEGSPLKRGAPGGAFIDGFEPAASERVFWKHANSAFIGTDLEARLRAEGITKLIVFGLTTDHCVSTTVRMAGNLGFAVRLVHDACATFPKAAAFLSTNSVFPKNVDGRAVFDADVIHETALASLHGEFAEVVASDALLAAWR